MTESVETQQHPGASNRLINAESLTEQELVLLHNHYCKLLELARSDVNLTDSHSVEEAVSRHRLKQKKPSVPSAALNAM